MATITLQELLEAGCHFGHKSERWYPTASEFIYTEKDGIHIIDLAKTKEALERAIAFVRDTVASGGEILFVATKRQAKDIVKEMATDAKAPYFTERWVGGYLTNWDSIRKNIEKANTMAVDEASGGWKKFPKHEQVKLGKMLKKLNMFYGGVLDLHIMPKALFIIDVRREDLVVREAHRVNIPIVAVVDTNSDPRGIDYVIPANDDAVGSIRLITKLIISAYTEGKKIREVETKTEEVPKAETKKSMEKAEPSPKAVKAPVADEKKPVIKESIKQETDTVKEAPKKRGRPKKIK